MIYDMQVLIYDFLCFSLSNRIYAVNSLAVISNDTVMTRGYPMLHKWSHLVPFSMCHCLFMNAFANMTSKQERLTLSSPALNLIRYEIMALLDKPLKIWSSRQTSSARVA